MMFKVHHAIADGLAIVLGLACYTDKYDKSAYIQTGTKLSLGKQLILLLISPFTVLHALIKFQVPVDRNPLKSGKPLIG